jgi:hypothetical protein
MRFLTETARRAKFRNSWTEKLLNESSIFFLGVRMSLLNPRSPVESSKLPPVLKLRRAGKAQSFGFLLTSFLSQKLI